MWASAAAFQLKIPVHVLYISAGVGVWLCAAVYFSWCCCLTLCCCVSAGAAVRADRVPAGAADGAVRSLLVWGGPPEGRLRPRFGGQTRSRAGHPAQRPHPIEELAGLCPVYGTDRGHVETGDTTPEWELSDSRLEIPEWEQWLDRRRPESSHSPDLTTVLCSWLLCLTGVWTAVVLSIALPSKYLFSFFFTVNLFLLEAVLCYEFSATLDDMCLFISVSDLCFGKMADD